ncbi:MAG: DinB family protein [Acidobacteriia bacterium]|nr:DinB family protein [Terriglobia bacterium]
MNTECLRISEQLRHAIEGGAWHGSSLKELLHGITVEQAQARPIAGGHSIWELLLHIGVWERVTLEAIKGTPIPAPPSSEWDWAAGQGNAEAWQRDVRGLLEGNRKLCNAVESFGDERLEETVPGRKYNFYRVLHGIVQHSVYHTGQIALLRKAFEKS